MNFYKNSFNTTQWEPMLWIFAQRQWGNENLLITSGSWKKTSPQIQLPLLLLICLNIWTCWDSALIRLLIYLALVDCHVMDTKCVELLLEKWLQQCTSHCSARVWGWAIPFSFSSLTLTLTTPAPPFFSLPFSCFFLGVETCLIGKIIRTFRLQRVLLRGTVTIN